jgi:hypothetical protein
MMDLKEAIQILQVEHDVCELEISNDNADQNQRNFYEATGIILAALGKTAPAVSRNAIVIDLVTRTSTEYRKQQAKMYGLDRVIRDIMEKLKDKTLPYKEYLALQTDLKNLQESRDKGTYIAEGMSMIREVLFDEWKD